MILFDSLAAYYGIDWLNKALTLATVEALVHKRRYGFLLGAAACVTGIAFGVMANSLAVVISNIILLYSNYRGYKKWGLTGYTACDTIISKKGVKNDDCSMGR